jgi:23S rRNA (cytosine1962-C5)-methyltransferase
VDNRCVTTLAEGRVRVARKGERRIRGGHPWVFRSDVDVPGGVPDGAIVEVTGPHGQKLGSAFYSSRSEITLRMLARGGSLSGAFLRQRLADAVAWRERVAEGARCCRLVHGEGDRLPSLLVDRYGDYLVVQTLCQGTERLKPMIVDRLVELVQPRGILERNDPKARSLEGLERRTGLLHGEVPEMVEVEEAGLRLEVDLWRGQKTGLFLDQRENHLAAAGYARGRVLDAFAYSAGFGLLAARHASEVLVVEASAEALALAARNARRNGFTNVAFREANAFDALRELEATGKSFDTVILDPPAFAKSRDAVSRARRGYKEINLRALKLLAPGGFLVTCSCSHHVREADLEGIVAEAAVDAGVEVAVVEKRRQARDHPVLLAVPETHYLKCLILRRL